jgi:hypothetical protein
MRRQPLTTWPSGAKRLLACLPFIVISFSVFPAGASPFDHSAFCVEMKGFAEKARADAGTMLDPITRSDGMAVLCESRVVTFYRYMTVAPTALRDGWKARKQSQWNDIYCKDAAWLPVIQAGWTVAIAITFVDGTRVFMEAKC